MSKGGLKEHIVIFVSSLTLVCSYCLIDQVEGEVLVDKIADLGLWPFFSSYACKL